MEIFQSADVSYDLYEQAVLNELKGLVYAGKSPLFPKLIHQFSDAARNLRTQPSYARKVHEKLCDANGSIYLRLDKPKLATPILQSQIAACCAMFDGAVFPNPPEFQQTASWALRNIQGLKNAPPSELKVLELKVHEADTVRMIQLLRAFGLFTKSTSSISQLSLGAAVGIKDIYSIHRLPIVSKIRSSHYAPLETRDFLKFETRVQHPEDTIVIVDGDPQHAETYLNYNKTPSPRVLALNVPTEVAIPIIANESADRGLAKRNLIIAIRVDHRMIPDVPTFLGSIYDIIDESADLIITIGAGHNLEQFRGRIEKIAEIYHSLKESQHNPIVIKLHEPGTVEEQRRKHLFGLGASTTYQILQAKVYRDKLKKFTPRKKSANLTL